MPTEDQQNKKPSRKYASCFSSLSLKNSIHEIVSAGNPEPKKKKKPGPRHSKVGTTRSGEKRLKPRKNREETN
jgi:hypothetical protein